MPRRLTAFLRHLDTCAVCRDELASFEEVVDRPADERPAASRIA